MPFLIRIVVLLLVLAAPLAAGAQEASAGLRIQQGYLEMLRVDEASKHENVDDRERVRRIVQACEQGVTAHRPAELTSLHGVHDLRTLFDAARTAAFYSRDPRCVGGIANQTGR